MLIFFFFPHRPRQLVNKRETERLLRRQTKACLNRRPLVWLEEPFDRGRVSDIFSWRFSIKVCPFFHRPPPTSVPPSAVKAESDNKSWLPPPSRDQSFLCVELWHTDSFTWCETRHEALNLNSFYHNTIISFNPSSPFWIRLSVSLSGL